MATNETRELARAIAAHANRLAKAIDSGTLSDGDRQRASAAMLDAKDALASVAPIPTGGRRLVKLRRQIVHRVVATAVVHGPDPLWVGRLAADLRFINPGVGSAQTRREAVRRAVAALGRRRGRPVKDAERGSRAAALLALFKELGLEATESAVQKLLAREFPLPELRDIARELDRKFEGRKISDADAREFFRSLKRPLRK